MEEIINYLISNYRWILPMVVSALGFLICFLKNGKISAKDVAKIMAAEEVIASALTIMIKNQEEEKNEETSSETKR